MDNANSYDTDVKKKQKRQCASVPCMPRRRIVYIRYREKKKFPANPPQAKFSTLANR